jgi:hypothetical protein
MCAAIPTPIRELSTLASNPEGCLKDFMNHFVELTSARQISRDAAAIPPANTILNRSALEMGFVGGAANAWGNISSK